MIEVFATRIGLGGPYQGRKVVGLKYLTKEGTTAHTSLQCGYVDSALLHKRPVIEEDGERMVLIGERTRPVKDCPHCPPERGDMAWRDEAKCTDSADPRIFSNRSTVRGEFIEEYCDQCPVVRECLESGAMMDSQNVGAIWGGLYFQVNDSKRRQDIEKRRKELG